MKFGENLKLIRKSKNISQEELADRLGVSRQSVSKWETGENYPSMFNILCLCDIFKCKINGLVHEDFTDINSLDEEIKMSVVKFKENEQKKMKGLSKAIYIAARIFKTVSIVGIVMSIVLLVGSFIIVPNTKINVPAKEITTFKTTYNYKYENNTLSINENKLAFGMTPVDMEQVEYFANQSNFYKLSLITVFTLSLFASCFCLFKMLSYMEKLFINIHDNDTPFSNDNVNNVKMIAITLGLYILIPDVIGSLASFIYGIDFAPEVDMMNYLIVVIIFAIAYIFKYGYEIQLDSKGKMYGDENE